MTDEARALLERLPGLLKEAPELRYQLYELLSETFARRDDLSRILDAMDRRFEEAREESNRRFEAMDRRFEAMDHRFEAMQAELREGLRSVRDSISALGSRWGIQTEEAVRSFAREFIGSEFGVRAERWQHRDAELDVVIQDSRHHLIEVKSWCDEAAILALIRHAEAYEASTGHLPARRMVITAHATGSAWRLALAQGVEIYSG
ncbi:MAG: DUF3782 domain-containing protein [Planctomycetes bacterium]|nr:DUF3782 domain-containing protein [Planctomycetota bacterium]